MIYTLCKYVCMYKYYVSLCLRFCIPSLLAILCVSVCVSLSASSCHTSLLCERQGCLSHLLSFCSDSICCLSSHLIDILLFSVTFQPAGVRGGGLFTKHPSTTNAEIKFQPTMRPNAFSYIEEIILLSHIRLHYKCAGAGSFMFKPL